MTLYSIIKSLHFCDATIPKLFPSTAYSKEKQSKLSRYSRHCEV